MTNKNNHFDVLVLGAGAAGMMAAWELALAGKKVGVIEARNRIGGRVHSVNDSAAGIPMELGAEFVHGKLELTLMLAKRAGIDIEKVKGSIWQRTATDWEKQKDFIEDFNLLNKKLADVKSDISVQQFINDYLQEQKFSEARTTLKNYVEGYYAADISRASTIALRSELNNSDEEQYRLKGGYTPLLEYIRKECMDKGVQLFLSSPVETISWRSGNVEARSRDRIWEATKILITVPTGVLASETISFQPAIPEYTCAAKFLGFGTVIKTLLFFKEAFWKNKELTGHQLGDLSFLFSEATVPTWWTAYPEAQALLTGWSGGPHGEKLENLSEDGIVEAALQSLADLFKVEVSWLQEQLRSAHVANWKQDPYCRGGYSFDVVQGGDAKNLLLQPVEQTLFFAGEALFHGASIGTVEAALETGRNAAHNIIASFKN